MKIRSTSLILLCMMLGGCTAASSASSAIVSSLFTTSAASISGAAFLDRLTKLDTEDSEEEYGETATAIKLNGTDAEISGNGARLSDGVITISRAGTYVLTGSFEGTVCVDSSASGTVHIVLNGASIQALQGAAIDVEQADKTIITSASGTENSLED